MEKNFGSSNTNRLLAPAVPNTVAIRMLLFDKPLTLIIRNCKWRIQLHDLISFSNVLLINCRRHFVFCNFSTIVSILFICFFFNFQVLWLNVFFFFIDYYDFFILRGTSCIVDFYINRFSVIVL